MAATDWGGGGGYSWALPAQPAPAGAPVAPAASQTVQVVPAGALEAWSAAQQAFNQAYLRDMMQYQDRWHAQEIAEQAAMRELQRQMALGYIGGQPTLERQLGEASLLGYYGGQPTLAREQWLASATGYLNGAPTLERELGTGNLGLGYLQLLASRSGPSDWLRYWGIVRAAEQTNLPSWAASLAQGLNLPAYQAPRIEPAALGASPWGGAPSTGVSAQGVEGQATLPVILPHEITAAQWRNLLPSEQQGLQGLVEAQGGWWPDFQQQMMAAFPTGTAGKRAVWQ